MIITVITTINGLTQPIDQFLNFPKTSNIIVIGDKGGNEIKNNRNGLQFYSYDEQLSLNNIKSTLMPSNHYSRKNIGYLLAIQQGAQLIFETDDDNFPYSLEFLDDLDEGYLINISEKERKFFNCYKLFTSEHIWPRGFPLAEVNTDVEFDIDSGVLRTASIVQGLADGDPDVDAIFRLSRKTSQVKFERKKYSYILPVDTYCPFNSQNTLWKQDVFVLMYLPVTVSFRFTDILRSYIAKRCLDHVGLSLAFANATVYQERNEHNLFKDFTDEIECYLNTPKVVDCLSSIIFQEEDTLAQCLFESYVSLNKKGLVSDNELVHVKNWLTDFEFVSFADEI